MGRLYEEVGDSSSTEEYAPRTHFVDEWDRGAGFQVEGEGSNLIVLGMRKLLAALLGNQSGYVGVQYWAVGSGPVGGSLTSPAPPTTSDTRLAAELARVPVTIGFVDDFGKATTGGAVSRNLQIQATFGPDVATGDNVEFALFGGTATASADTGIMLNRVTHPLKTKESWDSRRLTIVLSF